jgi:hypothetical protein
MLRDGVVDCEQRTCAMSRPGSIYPFTDTQSIPGHRAIAPPEQTVQHLLFPSNDRQGTACASRKKVRRAMDHAAEKPDTTPPW